MAKLTKEEQRTMERLSAKAEAPDEPPINKSVSFSIDLNDDNQIKKAVKLGLLSDIFGGDGDEDDDDDDADSKDDPPRRRGYFPEGKK